MSTAFQPNAFQTTAFQIAGGVAATQFEGNISFTQEGDTWVIDARISGGGVPGIVVPYVCYINGKRHVGTYWEIKRLIEEFAEEEAEKAIAEAKKPKKARIVVHAGKDIPKVAKPTEEQVLSVQAEIRDYYLKAYAQALIHAENEEEDELLLML